jgi:putative hydrolase of the HAD superfamily
LKTIFQDTGVVILNIVFDFGRVVFTWEPEKLISLHTSDQKQADMVHHAIFGHPDWIEIDRGTILLDEVTRRAAKRTGLPSGQIANITQSVPYVLIPIPETVELIRRVKNQGHRLYALSNMGTEAMQHLDKSYSFLNLFDGKVISSRINLVKPDAAIFHYLLDTYQLDPLQTIFIDDHAPNIEAAARLGIRTIHFTSPAQCEKALIQMGCL